MPKTKASSDARTRLIETAERLFYAEGIRAVGIDRIIAEAKVAKMTLYNHFQSKDDLVLAVLKYREERINEQFERAIAHHRELGAKPIDAFFRQDLSEQAEFPLTCRSVLELAATSEQIRQRLAAAGPVQPVGPGQAAAPTR